ncbi:hypothetical protein [Streptomyces sp. NPDC004728]|uniref:hypothetical protein n=1 Tax=Streptomyces sp. NPDC004728 TaxID=3154289 RepID=UPI0033A4863A
MTDDVFSRAVRRRNGAGMTFSRMEAESWNVGGKDGSRSTAWWNNMANYRMETPPGPKYLPGVAAVLKLSERRVAELIAAQWYGVRPDDKIPESLRSLVSVLEGVDPDDLPLLEQLAQSLSEKHTSKILLEGYKSQRDAT